MWIDGEEKLLFVDVETTGLLFQNEARIVEISYSLWGPSGKEKQETSLINPETPIPEMYTRIHGIDDMMVKNAPTFSEYWKDQEKNFQNTVIIAHNLSFDVGMINRELMRREHPPLGHPGIDTVPILKSLLPQEKNHKLSNLAKSLGIKHDKRHRAEDDVMALEEVLSVALAHPIESILGKLAVTLSFWGGAPSHKYFRDSVGWCQYTESPLSLVMADKEKNENQTFIKKKIERPVCSSKRVGDVQDATELPWLWKDIRRVEIMGVGES
jgi:DNA polymerase III epsilon subunit family exonuclease